jgi:hypothetical protein
MIVSVPIMKKAKNCSLLATFHQRSQRRRFSSSGGKVTPVAGAASSSPVIGDTMRGA